MPTEMNGEPMTNAFGLQILLEQKRSKPESLDKEQCFSLSREISKELADYVKSKIEDLNNDRLVRWNRKANISENYEQLDKNFSYMVDAIGLILHLEPDNKTLLDMWSESVKDFLLLYLSVLEKNEAHKNDYDEELAMDATYDHELDEHRDALVENWGLVTRSLLPRFKDSVLGLLGNRRDGDDSELIEKAIAFVQEYS